MNSGGGRRLKQIEMDNRTIQVCKYVCISRLTFLHFLPLDQQRVEPYEEEGRVACSKEFLQVQERDLQMEVSLA